MDTERGRGLSSGLVHCNHTHFIGKEVKPEAGV
jgi:hypothetical protein